MNVLVVGAGAVGQVYGYHLAKGGADVTFFVRPKYADEARQGYLLYPLNSLAAYDPRRPVAPVRFSGFGVVTSADEVRQRAWDAVIVTVPSSALPGPWLGELLAATAAVEPAPTVVTLQPGPDDRALFLAHVPEERLVQGVITLVSYHAPLAGETRFAEPGMAYWLPPIAPAPFSGPAARAKAIVALFRKGRLPAIAVHRRTPRGDQGARANASAPFMAWLAAFDAGGFTLEGLADPELTRITHAAAREIGAIEHAPKLLAELARGALIRGALRVGARLTPFPMETVLGEHFSKLRAQTRHLLAGAIDKGRAAALPTTHLEALQARLSQ